MDAAAVADEVAGHQAVFVDTNLDTHLVVVVSPADTVSHLKQKLLSGHNKCFPEFGEIKIHALKVKRKGHYYHLPDSMLVYSAFLRVKTNWFFFAVVSFRERNDRPLSNGKNVPLDGPSNDVAVVVYGSSSQFVCDQARDQGVRNSDQFFEDDFESLRRKVFDNNEGNGQSSLNEIIQKSGDDRQQEFQLLNEKGEVRDGTKEGNSKSCSTEVTCTVSAEESLDAGREEKKKKKRKKRVLSELPPKNNDGDVANVPEKDISPGGGDSTFGSMEKAERELSPSNDDADGPDLPAKEIPSDDLGLTFGSQEKGEDKLGAQYGSGEGNRDLTEKETPPDDLGPTFESLEKGEDEFAAQDGYGAGDANHGSSHQELESEHVVEDQFRSTDVDPQKGAQKKKGKKKKSSEAASDNVFKDQHHLIVAALRATTLRENGPSSKVAEDIANVEKDHQADVSEKSKSLEGGDGQSSHHPREVLQESVSKERHKVENGSAAREAAEVGKEVLPDSRKDDSVAREMQENGLRGKDKSKKKRKGIASDSVNQVIPSVPSATTGENGEEEVINDHIEPSPMEEPTEILTELKDSSVTEASNIAREISPAGAASLSAGKKSKKRKKNADDATAGSHQSTVTDYHAVIKSPEFKNIVRNSFDENNDSRHDVARTLLHMSGNNAAETFGFEHENPTLEAITVKEKDDADVPAAGKKRKSKKAKKSIAGNQTVPGLETISILASQLPLDKSDKGIPGSEAGKTSPLHGALAGLDGVTENVEVPMGIHDEPDENLEKKAESNKKKSKKKNPRAASVLEGAPLAGHDVEELEGNLDTNGRRTETTGKQNSTACITDGRVDGEADDTRSNREEESVPLSQNKHPSENMGNKSKKKRTKWQNSVMIDTAADYIGRKTDKLSHNEAEPEPQVTVPVEKPQENLGNEKANKQTRRKLKLSAGDSSHSLLEETNNLKATASLHDMHGKVDTNKIAMKTKSTKASSVDEGIFSSGNDVETEPEPSHPRGIDAIASGHNPPIANGISDPGRHQKNAPKEKGGSKSKTHELNSNSVQDEDHQEVASDGVPTDLGKKAKKL
ncbi:hypothetical protein AKJ16_DCAP20994 [Drosera capensis]